MIDASGFFRYPTEPDLPAITAGFLTGKTQEEWATFLAYTETRRFRKGERPLEQGAADRALYLLVDGRLEGPGGVIEPVTTIGEGSFFDGSPRRAAIRALTDGELVRLGWDAFEALAAREPILARDVLVDLGRILAARLRGADAGWTG